MYTLRTRFKKEIVSEFLPPKKRSNKVIIICGGMPSYPSKRELQFFFRKKNFWSFVPRYRGSWESDGTFMRKSPHLDVLDIVDSLPKGFADSWSGKRYKVKAPEIYLVGSSFGGPAVILASKDRRVKKAVAISPVTNWHDETKLEPLNRVFKFSKMAYGNGYRLHGKNWDKLKTGKFFNPIFEINKLDPKKILLIHAKDDTVVYAKSSKTFSKKLGCKLILLKSGGHLGSDIVMEPAFWKQVKEFFE